MSDVRPRTRRGHPIALLAFTAVLTTYFLSPLLWLVVGSTKNNEQLTNTFGLFPAIPGNLSENFVKLFTDGGGIYGRWLLNSIIYAGTIAVVSTAFCALAGFAFAKYRFRGKAVMYGIVLGSVMVPNTALVLPIFLFMNQLGLVNSYWAVILPSLVNPLGLFLFRIFWDDSLPNELLDAGRIDGARDLRLFWSIGLPLVRNGLVTVGLLAFVGAWNNFFLPVIVLSDEELFPVVQGLASWNLRPASGVTVDVGVVLLGSLISVIPLVFAFFRLAKYWQTGLTAGATKS